MLPSTSLSLEAGDRAFFQALRAAPTDDARRTLAALDDAGWRHVAERALLTHTAPLLYARLRSNGLLGLPPDAVATRLRRVHAWNVARAAALDEERRTATRALAGAGVKALALKGAHLALTLYEPGARAMGDVDLLVERDQVRAAHRALVGAGYGPRDLPPAEAWGRHLPALSRPGGLPLELHWTLRDPGARHGPDDAGVWERARPLPDGSGLGMEPLDALLFACHHLACHHGFVTANGVSGLVDVAVLAEREAPDPEALAARAEAWGSRAGTFLCLRLARDLLGAPVSDEVLARLSVDGWEEHARVAVHALLNLVPHRVLLLRTRPSLNPPPVGGARFLVPPWGRSTLRHLRSVALPPADDVALEHEALRGGLAWLGYPLHWARLSYAYLGLARWPFERDRLERIREERRRLAGFVGT